MDKKIYKAVSERSGGVCEVCGRGGYLELHHAVNGSGKRKQHEIEDTCFHLCYECHRGNQGVHNGNRKLNLFLKKIAQKRLFDKGYNEKEVRQFMGGRIYLK